MGLPSELTLYGGNMDPNTEPDVPLNTWEAHCELFGEDINDEEARDEFERAERFEIDQGPAN